jgi:hypothetical protein
MKLLTGNYVTGFLSVRVVTIVMQRLDKRSFNNRPPCREVILTIGATEEFSVEDGHGKFVCEEELKTV